MKSFIQKCLDGEAIIENLGQAISNWYLENPRYDRRQLHEFIGLTWDEYLRWEKGNVMIPYMKYDALKALKKLVK